MEIEATFISEECEIFGRLSSLAQDCESWWACLGSDAATSTSPFCRIVNQFQHGNLDKLEYAVLGLSPRSGDFSSLKLLHKKGVLRVITSCEGLFEPNVYVFKTIMHCSTVIISGISQSSIFGNGMACAVTVTCSLEHPFALGIESFLQSSLAMGRLLSPPELHYLETLIGPGQSFEAPGDLLEAIKLYCKKRDKNKCRCCGEDNRNLLLVDYVTPPYLQGKDEIDNFQSICRNCHSDKGVDPMNFLKTRTQLATCPIWLRELPIHIQFGIVTLTDIEKFIRRTINFFYRCSAVKTVSLQNKGKKDIGWRVELEEGNDGHWLQQFAQRLLAHINQNEKFKNYGASNSLTIESKGYCVTFSL